MKNVWKVYCLNKLYCYLVLKSKQDFICKDILEFPEIFLVNNVRIRVA